MINARKEKEKIFRPTLKNRERKEIAHWRKKTLKVNANIN